MPVCCGGAQTGAMSIHQEMTMHSHAHPDSRVLARGPALSDEHSPYQPARRHWPGVVAALIIAAVVALLAVNETDPRDMAQGQAPAGVTESTSATPSDAMPPSSERPVERDVEDTSGVIVTDQQPVDVSEPVSEETSPAQ
jgi:hypothetical protein